MTEPNPETTLLHPNTTRTTSAFTPLTNEKYKELQTDLLKIEISPADFKDCISKSFIDSIHTNLKEQNISFIIGPIRIGKTFLLKLVENSYDKSCKLITTFKSGSLSNKKTEITTPQHLYFQWLNVITSEILHIQKKKISELDDVTKARVENFDKFNSWLDSNKSDSDGGLEAFLRIITKLKIKLKFKQKLLIAFHLDDVHTYTSEDVFRELRDDLTKMPNLPFDEELSVRLLVTSRFLPKMNLTKQIVNFMPHLDLKGIEHISKCLDTEDSDNVAIRKLILEKTDGYLWFVIRFLKLYLHKRIQGDTTHPIELAKQLFDNKSYWINDSIFGKDASSDFLEELVLLIEEKSIKVTVKSDFKKFINLESIQTILNNGLMPTDHYLVRQSGFFKMDDSSEIFYNNGCFLLKEHFKEKIIDLLP
jgi:hypothetical protein